jgi:hypothetical protein
MRPKAIAHLERAASLVKHAYRGFSYGGAHPLMGKATPLDGLDEVNPLLEYFEAHTRGPGIWKWRHYFAIYHRHLARFRDKNVHMLEVGVYSGGSLSMWRSYFGPTARIYGVDIEPACKIYESAGVRIFIGNQASSAFWSNFRQQVPELDIVIDDGGHRPYQQIATLEALLPHLRPGGVYICEDVEGMTNPFLAYVAGLVGRLNAAQSATSKPVATTAFQQAIAGVHFYPYVVVIEKRSGRLPYLESVKRGSEWQPFL